MTASLTFSLRRLNSASTSGSVTVIQSVSARCSFSITMPRRTCSSNWSVRSGGFCTFSTCR